MKCQMCLCIDHFGPKSINLEEAEQTDIAPDLKDWQEFASAVNEFNTKLKVVRCAARFEQMQGRPSIALKSYIGFCFTQADLNKNCLRYYELFHFLSLHFAERPLSHAIFMFDLKQTDFNGDRVQGYSVDFHVQGQGDSKEAAREAANAAYACLSTFLNREDFPGRLAWPMGSNRGLLTSFSE